MRALVLHSSPGPLVLEDAPLPVAAAGELLLRVEACGLCRTDLQMTDIPSFPYELLWGERVWRSVSNLTRQDGRVFFALAANMKLNIAVTSYPLAEANAAIADLRNGRLQGAAVLVP